MTSFSIERLGFEPESVRDWAILDRRHSNWPVVYVMDGTRPYDEKQFAVVYVGESTSAKKRFAQHLQHREGDKRGLDSIRVIVDETFNKSVCHDLESHLIQLLSGDGAFCVLNRNDGIVDADYYDRASYREGFQQVFEQLSDEGLFTRSIPEIRNSDLFKLSPFKALNSEQAIALEDILEGLFSDLEDGRESTAVIQGSPGTGKTIIAIWLMKLLKDIETSTSGDDLDPDTMFADFFTDDIRELLHERRIGLVVPQQSLRDSIRKVFKRTPGLDPSMVLTPFDVGLSENRFDLLIVDEAHRLSQRANQPSGMLNQKFRMVTERLFEHDDKEKTQLDWIIAQSAHRIFLVDGAQSVRPADLPAKVLEDLLKTTRADHRLYPLTTQMRVDAGGDYIGFVRAALTAGLPGGISDSSPAPSFSGYDFRVFDNLKEMREEILKRDDDVGLSRMVAGFAWPWVSRKDRDAYDIELDGLRLRWNGTDKDWINSPNSREEVGSIHTVQGYDLNYAGVIIGLDLRFDPVAGRMYIDADSYHDKKGKENVPRLGKSYAQENLQRYITNAYSVLMTRGMRGTYVYACDPPLRQYLHSLTASVERPT